MPVSKWKGKTTIVTGGRMGIGRAITEKFASLGSGVAIIGRDRQAGEATATALSDQYGVDIRFYVCDVADGAQVRNTVSLIIEQMGVIDFLVNNAGIYPSVPFLQMDEALFAHVFDLNVKGVFLMTREVVNQSMRGRQCGKIVTVSSVDGWHPTKGISAYASSKAAVNSLIKSFAIELADDHINSNGVAPGWVATEPVIKAGRWKSQIDGVLKKRMAQPAEIGELIAFLCSEEADYINGEIINISGGLILNA